MKAVKVDIYVRIQNQPARPLPYGKLISLFAVSQILGYM